MDLFTNPFKIYVDDMVVMIYLTNISYIDPLVRGRTSINGRHHMSLYTVLNE